MRESCSVDDIDQYCNGLLDSGVVYYVSIRAFTQTGYADSGTTTVVTANDNRAIYVMVAIIFILAMVITAFVSWIYVHKYSNRQPRMREKGSKGFRNRVSTMIHRRTIDPTKVKRKRPVSKDAFNSYVCKLERDSGYKLAYTYEELAAISPHLSTNEGEQPENQPKNRYINILPFDDTRVKLQRIGGEPTTDYINANYIPGENSSAEYIAAQGPLEGTVNDFWRMIWEQRVEVIVMLTKTVEKNKKKCEKYWPASGKPTKYGDIVVELLIEQAESDGDLIIRTLVIEKNGELRNITQCHLIAWPDFGCPKHPNILLNCISSVRQQCVDDMHTPMLVHCSAGVGRSGAYIAVDRLVQCVNEDSMIDVFGLVYNMRCHRTHMVQTEEQFGYIHKCISIFLNKQNEHIVNDYDYKWTEEQEMQGADDSQQLCKGKTVTFDSPPSCAHSNALELFTLKTTIDPQPHSETTSTVTSTDHQDSTTEDAETNPTVTLEVEDEESSPVDAVGVSLEASGNGLESPADTEDDTCDSSVCASQDDAKLLQTTEL
ncbi:PREDICTED: receptor-type tyrosine-protein phosphatase O-like [Priapulus caudatus]|uniref:Receptor-type tyrosine-protein phosphatase O-like n=1 Tax=Priapulus caudatus TaxID=37621 RepID=A0ABM1EB13_PRICU|nr:PREDICTED: receptor-type tyrosine-protein phosphatase O-like [Priapulus caudatus]